GNVRVIHPGQGLALGFEPRNHMARVQTGLNDLQGNSPADWLLLLGQVNDTPPTFAELFPKLIGADLLDRLFTGGGQGPGSEKRQLLSPSMGLDQAYQALEQLRVPSAGAFQERHPLQGRQRDRLIKQFFSAFRNHAIEKLSDAGERNTLSLAPSGTSTSTAADFRRLH